MVSKSEPHQQCLRTDVYNFRCGTCFRFSQTSFLVPNYGSYKNTSDIKRNKEKKNTTFHSIISFFAIMLRLVLVEQVPILFIVVLGPLFEDCSITTFFPHFLTHNSNSPSFSCTWVG